MVDNCRYDPHDRPDSFWQRHRKSGLPELLAPAGSLEHLRAAVNAGADAVYIGGRMFGARAYADNPDEDKLVEGIRYAHFHGRRLYLTVNTLMKEEELNQVLYGFLMPYYEAGLDGVIVQDLGTASFIHRTFPEMEIHASTQMTITHSSGAAAAKALGMTRVVPARELSLDELTRIRQETGLEIEVFVHGALCYCYSGQCLLSSHYGGRSGNRGRCAQPCRLPYRNDEGKEACYLSPRDLCSIGWLPSLIEAGMDSLKIEGRMKNVDYVAGVTSIYRSYLDLYDRLRKDGHPEDYRVLDEDLHALEELYCRGGFTDGYWKRHNGPSMMAVRTQKNLGRKIGEIRSAGRHKIKVDLVDSVSPKDILVIPTADSEADREIVLTVPSEIKVENTFKKSTGHIKKGRKSSSQGPAGYGKSITLNIPAGSAVRPGMAVYRRRNERLSDRIEREILSARLTYPVSANVRIHTDKPVFVTLTSQGVSVSIEGPVPGRAVKRSISEDDIRRQFGKTGETPFYLKDLTVHLADHCFLPLSALKQLRQDAYRELYEAIDGQFDRRMTSGDKGKILVEDETGKASVGDEEEVKTREIIAVVYDQSVLNQCLAMDFYTGICLPADSFHSAELGETNRAVTDAGKKAYLSLPAIMRHGKDRWEGFCLEYPWEGIYVHNINEAYWLAGLKGYCGKRIAAASFYQWNRESLRISRELGGLDAFQLPYELSLTECRKLLKISPEAGTGDKWEAGTADKPRLFLPELMVYGRIPLMVSVQCQKKLAGRCDCGNSTLWLTDSHGRELPVSTHCEYCYNRIWSHDPVNLMISKEMPSKEFRDMINDISRFTFDFYLADSRRVKGAAEEFRKILSEI